MIRVLIVDDQPLLRAAIESLLRHEPDVEVVGQAGDGTEAIAEVRGLMPDVVLMDIRMPGMDGVEATDIIASDPTLSSVRVLILTTFEEEEHLMAALAAGASGFIGKGTHPDELARAIRTVHAGDALLSPTATKLIVSRSLATSRAGTTPDSRISDLTPRELEIFRLVGHGLSNEEIGAQFHISAMTVKTHVNRVMMKLDAHDRAQLVIAAYESGTIEPGRPRESG